MTFFDDSDFAPIIPMRDGSQVTEMEEIARGEEFIQAGVCPPSSFSLSPSCLVLAFLVLRCLVHAYSLGMVWLIYQELEMGVEKITWGEEEYRMSHVPSDL